MAFSPKQCDDAQAAQLQAAHNNAPQVRLVAGPGSGKSRAIEARVCWLLQNGVEPNAIRVVSFTRAASRDLRNRIDVFCSENGLAEDSDEGEVQVSTLHSLALGVLAKAELLGDYPAKPLVLDDWELENIFDREFRELHNISKKRCEEIRDFYQAYWDTESYSHPYYVKPDDPITDEERQKFERFNRERTQLYSCILSGELVRKCVEQMQVNGLDPSALLGLRHLIVDEFQDLNPTDQKFLSLIAAKGVFLFVAGDDDQSIYSFRYASPAGIQDFKDNYKDAGLNALDACFRCTPQILRTASTLVSAFSGSKRIHKHHFSLYETAVPKVDGVVHRWRFTSDETEAAAIASSCDNLIKAGVEPKEILVLLSKKRSLGQTIMSALRTADVPHTPLNAASFSDSDEGRLVLSLLRIMSNPEDYVAHRTILSLMTGVGTKTCNDIAQLTIDSGLNFKNLFYNSLPANVFPRRLEKFLAEGYLLCGMLKDWKKSDKLNDRREALSAIVNKVLGEEGGKTWQAYSAKLPGDIDLATLREFVGANSDEERAGVISSAYRDAGVPVEDQPQQPNRVQVMTMHGAKGLSARIVFVPALDEQTFPGEHRKPYPLLINEAARMLYVSITRARAACVLTYATNRRMNGRSESVRPSRFTLHLNGPFTPRTTGLEANEISGIMSDCRNL